MRLGDFVLSMEVLDLLNRHSSNQELSYPVLRSGVSNRDSYMCGIGRENFI